MIPIRTELEALLKKHDYHPPKLTEQQLNGDIKIIGRKAGISELVELEGIRGGRKERKTYPKFELIKSHTARRTGATNMYLSGIPPIDIMKITGHKKESNFLKYIWVSKEETADKLSVHPYFK
ncbi:MAG: tyrosine-type recombinase/integrase [Bacteroidota bacterium]